MVGKVKRVYEFGTNHKKELYFVKDFVLNEMVRSECQINFYRLAWLASSLV